MSMQRALKWEVWPRGGGRSIAYSLRDMQAALIGAGCDIERPCWIITATRVLEPGEDPKHVREQVTSAIRRVHPKAPRKFLGVVNV